MSATFHDLDGASVFVSGGASGIAAAVVEGFLAQGARVAFCDLEDPAPAVAAFRDRHGAAPLGLRADVTDIPALHGALDRAAEAHGPITVLVNSAARDTRHSLEGFSVDQWDASIAVNLRHHFFAAQRVAPMMRAAGGGSIVNFSSVSFMMGQGIYPSYVAAKAGIVGLTRGLARDLGPDAIRANAVVPGWVLTERQLALWATPEAVEEHLGMQCLKARMAPEDIVGGVLFLASDVSRMMTGQVLVIDGGVVHSG